MWANAVALPCCRIKPKSLFAQASAKKLGAEGGRTGSSGAALFGDKAANPFGGPN